MPSVKDVAGWSPKPQKRNRDPTDGASNSSAKQSKLSDYWLASTPVITQNRFGALTPDEPVQMDSSEKSEELPKKDPKPPPIFVQGVDNIKPLKDLLAEMVGEEFSLKSLRDGEVKIQIFTADSYRAVTKELRARNTEMHSYQFKKDRAFRVLLKGMHPSTDTDEITRELEKLGHTVQSIANVKHRTTKRPLPMFYVNLQKKDNNKMIYQITRLMHCVIEFQAPYAKKELPQCTRCQSFGHTKSFCLRKPRCVKCQLSHLSSECPRKVRDDEVRCANCGGPHPANYRGCEVHKQLQQRYFPKLREKIFARSKQQGDRPINQNNETPGLSYSDVAQGGKRQINNDVINDKNPINNNGSSSVDFSSDMTELKNMMKDLMLQMGSILSLLTTVVSKLK